LHQPKIPNKECADYRTGHIFGVLVSALIATAMRPIVFLAGRLANETMGVIAKKINECRPFQKGMSCRQERE
jgi:hypothetical protein